MPFGSIFFIILSNSFSHSAAFSCSPRLRSNFAYPYGALARTLLVKHFFLIALHLPAQANRAPVSSLCFIFPARMCVQSAKTSQRRCHRHSRNSPDFRVGHVFLFNRCHPLNGRKLVRASPVTVIKIREAQKLECDPVVLRASSFSAVCKASRKCASASDSRP